MTFKLPFTLAFGTCLFITGCAETQTLGSTLGQAVNTVVKSSVTGVQNGANQSVAKNTNSGALPKEDMVYLLGWMEDGCLGSKKPYDQIHEKFITFRNSVVKTVYDPQKGGVGTEYKYIATPRSQWAIPNPNAIKDIKVFNEYGSNVIYKITFNENVKYRGQPLDYYVFSFMAETEGSEDNLVFGTSANVASIWSSFYTREYKPYWGDMDKVYTKGASLDPQTNTITCQSD